MVAVAVGAGLAVSLLARAGARFRRGLLFCLLSFGIPIAHAQFAVSDGGTPSYSQAIAVPPGVAGMSPKIGLFYAGGGVNGPVGHGWSVQGISSITRCSATLATDGRTVGVAYGAGDKLCLDGQRLIQTDSNGNASAFPQSNDSIGLASGAFTEYRTEKDTYARIRAFGTASGTDTSTGPAYFKVWTKSGQIYEYGASPSADANSKALVLAQGKTVAMVWAVARIGDTFGNYIDFKYEQRDVAWGSGSVPGSPALGHEWNLLEIQYSGNKVLFAYADRASRSPQDAAEAYHLGSKNVSIRLLQSITTYVNAGNTATLGVTASAVAVRTTKLTYTNGAVTGRSRVSRIQECAGDATSTRCLPSTNFTYAAGGSDAYQANAAFASSTLSTTALQALAGNLGVLVGDFNGDGKSDFILWSDTPSQNKLYLSNGDGTFSLSSNFNITDRNLFRSDGCYYSMLVDIDGDGLVDILRYSASTNLDGTGCTFSDGQPGAGQVVLYKNNGNGTFTALTYSGPSLLRHKSVPIVATPIQRQAGDHDGWSSGANFFLLDIDGDGKLDIVTTILPFYSVVAEPIDPCASQECTQVWKGNGDGTFSKIPVTNVANTSLYVAPSARTGLGVPRSIVDVNGDGLADIVGIDRSYFTTSGAFLSNGDGNFSAIATQVGATCDIPIDFNGDGRTDCLSPGYDGLASHNILFSAGGAGMYPLVAAFNLKATGQELAPAQGPSSPVTLGSAVVDTNGDGRGDILRWKDDPTQNALYISNGDGTFTTSSTFNLNTSVFQLSKSDGTATFLTGDFTGHGNTEILRLKASPTSGAATSNQLYVKVDPTPPDQLISVSTATGSTTALYYVPLSNSTPGNGVSGALGARYAPDRGTSNAAVSPTIDLNFPMYVVATVASDTGVGSTKTYAEYAYLGLKADTKGRGLLGFRDVRRQNTGANGDTLTVDTEYLQTHPYIGVAARTSTYYGTLATTGSAPILSRTTNAYCDTTSAAPPSSIIVPTPPPTRSQPPSAPAPCATAARIQRPYLYQALEEGWDASTSSGAPAQGVALPTVSTLNDSIPGTGTGGFNSTGDPTNITVTTSGTAAGIGQTFTKAVVNQYQASNTTCADYKTCSWVLGRLTQAQVTNTVPNSLSSIATSAGTGTYATATTGAGPLQGAVLTPILAFGGIPSGSTSTRIATLANDGAAALNVAVPGGTSVTGTDFSFVSTTCASSLPAGSNCTVTVQFAPMAIGSRSGTLTISTGGGSLTSSLSGTGGPSPPNISATPSPNPLTVTTTTPAAASGTVSFNNAGQTATTLTLSASAGNSVTPSTLSCPASASCGSVTVTSPTAAGTYNGTLSVSSSGGGGVPSPVAVSYTVLTAPAITATPNPNPLTVTTTSPTAASGTVTYTNGGQTPTNLTLSVSGGSTISPGTLSCPANGPCGSVTVTSPTAVGTYSGTLTGTSSAGGSVPSAVVTYTVTGSTATVQSNAAFGTNPVGATIANQSVTVQNVGNANMSLTPSGYSSPFSLVQNGCSNIAPTASCSITFASANNVVGTANQNITLSGATSGNVTANLSGTINGTVATLVSGDLTFGTVTYLAGTQTKTLTIRNDGNLNLTLSNLSGLSAPFALAGNTCTNIAPGLTCTMQVTMTTSFLGSWTFSSSTVGSNIGITLNGSGSVQGSILALTNAAAQSFVSVQVNATPPQVSWNFTNSGNAAMSLALSTVNLPFGVNNGCLNVPGPGSCSITVQMATGTAGTYSQSAISVSGATTGSRSDLSLSGTVTAGTTTLTGSPTTLAFGTVAKQIFRELTLTLNNTGNADAVGLTYGWSPAGYYSTNGGTCPAAGGSIPAHGSCTVIVHYEAGCQAGSFPGTFTTSGGNFTSVVTNLTAATSSSGTCN